MNYLSVGLPEDANASQILAVKLKGVSCNYDTFSNPNSSKLAYNDLFNGGCTKSKNDKTTCWNWWMTADEKDADTYQINDGRLGPVLEGHCRESRADMVFMFMVAVLLLATALMLFLRRRKGY